MGEKQSTAWCWIRNYRFQKGCRSPASPGITTPATSASFARRQMRTMAGRLGGLQLTCPDYGVEGRHCHPEGSWEAAARQSRGQNGLGGSVHSLDFLSGQNIFCHHIVKQHKGQ